MNRITLMAATALLLGAGGVAYAQTYNTAPADDAQYQQCKSISATRYTGGTAASPIAGQTKLDAFCTCMWNETPDDFKGNLVAFSETAKGAAMNKTCEKYSNWEG
jgi:hypothetical protein